MQPRILILPMILVFCEGIVSCALNPSHQSVDSVAKRIADIPGVIPLFTNSPDSGRTDFFTLPTNNGAAHIGVSSENDTVKNIEIEFMDVTQSEQKYILESIRKIFKGYRKPPQIIARHLKAEYVTDFK